MQRSDDELIEDVRIAYAAGTGPADAFDVLVQRHSRRLRHLLFKLPADRVDDLLQEVFIEAFEAIVAGRAIDDFAAWVNGVARNTVADFWRGREGQALIRDRDTSPLVDPAADGGFGAVELWDLVEGLLGERAGVHRAIVRLAVLEGRPAAEVADLTGASADNVYQVAKRFRDDLRRLLAGAELERT